MHATPPAEIDHSGREACEIGAWMASNDYVQQRRLKANWNLLLALTVIQTGEG